MEFKEWTIQHDRKKNAILKKLEGKTQDEKMEYFLFDNMVKNEPEFCPLYDTETKCHEYKDLNCFHCGCPHFKMSDDEPFYVYGNNIKVMSVWRV